MSKKSQKKRAARRRPVKRHRGSLSPAERKLRNTEKVVDDLTRGRVKIGDTYFTAFWVSGDNGWERTLAQNPKLFANTVLTRANERRDDRKYADLATGQKLLTKRMEQKHGSESL